MTAITSCNFMVRGYHYTEPTSPSRTDSCRIYIDTDLEESDVEDEVWTPPDTAYLDESTTTLLHLKGIHGFYVQT